MTHTMMVCRFLLEALTLRFDITTLTPATRSRTLPSQWGIMRDHWMTLRSKTTGSLAADTRFAATVGDRTRSATSGFRTTALGVEFGATLPLTGSAIQSLPAMLMT